MAFTPTAAKVWNLGEDLDEGLRLCYHKGPPEGRVLVHARRAGQARPHVEQNPLTRLHPPCNPMSENYMTLQTEGGGLTHKGAVSTRSRQRRRPGVVSPAVACGGRQGRAARACGRHPTEARQVGANPRIAA